MTQPCSDLIYDVGLFGGEDTAYYLFRGYKVIAVEANPAMIEKSRLRFAREIQDRRLILLNVGISDGPGSAIFWVSDHSDWSSFDRSIASRNGTTHRPIQVSTVSFTQILAEYGLPHYLKIDIEGSDMICLEALKEKVLPKYISVESECVGDTTTLSDEKATASLELLREIGYTRFKLVAQGKGWRKERLKFGFDFSYGSSGPWGDDIQGDWISFEKAKSIYLEKRHAYFSQQQPLYTFWFDWHATYEASSYST